MLFKEVKFRSKVFIKKQPHEPRSSQRLAWIPEFDNQEGRVYIVRGTLETVDSLTHEDCNEVMLYNSDHLYDASWLQLVDEDNKSWFRNLFRKTPAAPPEPPTKNGFTLIRAEAARSIITDAEEFSAYHFGMW